MSRPRKQVKVKVRLRPQTAAEEKQFLHAAEQLLRELARRELVRHFNAKRKTQTDEVHNHPQM